MPVKGGEPACNAEGSTFHRMKAPLDEHEESRPKMVGSSLLRLRKLLGRSDYTVVAAEMHECEQAEDTVIISIEIPVLVRLVFTVPESLDKFL